MSCLRLQYRSEQKNVFALHVVYNKYRENHSIQKEETGHKVTESVCSKISINTVGSLVEQRQFGAWGTVDYFSKGLQASEFTHANTLLPRGYTGHEHFFSVGLIHMNGRMYDSNLGRLLSPDDYIQEPFNTQSYNRYGYVVNNSLVFIDPDGEVFYPITIRSFAPFETFGFGYHGDNRKYSNVRSYRSGKGPTARIHQVINFDTDKTTLSTNVWSSPTFKTDNLNDAKTGTPSVSIGEFITYSSGDSKTFNFDTHYEGSNPDIKMVSPNIDVFSNFLITENKKAGILTISGKLTGDDFPSTEAFISDPSGQNLFIGVGQIDKGVDKDWGPLNELYGEHKNNPITNFNFTVITDKEGNFTGVNSSGTNYSIQDWNKLLTNINPVEK